MLHMAARYGKESLYKTILSKSPELIDTVTVFPLWQITDRGQNVLHLACRRGNKSLVTSICKTRPDFIDAVDSKGDTPFATAIKYINAHAAKVMLHYRPELINTVDMSDLVTRDNLCHDMGRDLLKVLIDFKPALIESVDPEMVTKAAIRFNFKMLVELLTIRPDLNDGNILNSIIRSLTENDIPSQMFESFIETLNFVIKQNPATIDNTDWGHAKDLIAQFMRNEYSHDEVTKSFITVGGKSLGRVLPKTLNVPNSKISELLFDDKVISFSYLEEFDRQVF